MSLLKDQSIRYRSTSTSFTTSFNNNKPNTIKGLSSTNYLTTRNPEDNLHTKISFRKSFTINRNSQGRMDNLGEGLQVLNSDVMSSRSSIKEVKLKLAFVKEKLLERALPQIESDLLLQLEALNKQFCINKKTSKIRYDSINSVVEELQRSSKEMSKGLHDMNLKLTEIENCMGYYSGADKHRC